MDLVILLILLTKSVNVMKRLVTSYTNIYQNVKVLIELDSLLALVNMLMNSSIVKTLLLVLYVQKVIQKIATDLNVLNLVVKKINRTLMVDLVKDLSNTVRKIVHLILVILIELPTIMRTVMIVLTISS